MTRAPLEKNLCTRAATTAARSILILVFFLTTTAPIFSQDNSLAFKRAQHLRHGINLSHWFSQVFDPKGYTKEHFDAYDTDRKSVV